MTDVQKLAEMEKLYYHQLTPGFEPSGMLKDILELIFEVKALTTENSELTRAMIEVCRTAERFVPVEKEKPVTSEPFPKPTEPFLELKKPATPKPKAPEPFELEGSYVFPHRTTDR
jgi:hypothetical protein